MYMFVSYPVGFFKVCDLLVYFVVFDLVLDRVVGLLDDCYAG